MAKLELKGITKSFGNQMILKEVTLTFPEVGLYFLLGASGTGKTTLFRILMGIEPVEQGKIFFDGKELKNELDFQRFRQQYLAVMMQQKGIISYWNVKQNSALGQWMAKKTVSSTLKMMHMEHLLNQKANVLSGGEKQRICFLRGLLKGAAIFCCDEPTSNLDETHSHALFAQLKAYSTTHLVLCITHEKAYAKLYGDGTYILKNKTIIPPKNTIQTQAPLQKKQSRVSMRFFFSLLVQSMRTFFRRYIFVALALSFCCTSFLCMLGLKTATEEVIPSQCERLPDFGQCKITMTEEKVIDADGFRVVEQSVPEVGALNQFLTIPFRIRPHYDTFLQQYGRFYQKQQNLAFSIFTLLDYGRYFEDQDPYALVLNQLAFDLLSDSQLPLHYQLEVTIETMVNGKIFLDTIQLQQTFTTFFIVKEAHFLSGPAVYLSIEVLEQMFAYIRLNKVSHEEKQTITLYDRFYQYSHQKDNLLDFSLQLYVPNEYFRATVELLSTIEVNQKRIEVFARAIQVEKTLQSLVDMVDVTMQVFVIACFLLAIALFSIVLYSLYHERKQEIGLLSLYGFSDMQLLTLFASNGFFVGAVAAFLSLFLCSIFSFILQILFKQFLALPHWFSFAFLQQTPIPFLFEMLFCLSSALGAMLFAFCISSCFYKKTKYHCLLEVSR